MKKNPYFSFLKHCLFEGTEKSVVKDCEEKHLLYIFIFEFFKSKMSLPTLIGLWQYTMHNTYFHMLYAG